ncbi:hypothetical protein [Levilactobacillus parabrevis]|uniref:Uncharacterized protein n=1 Tax=Levilactobacillus parabrevis ATCC 53295 TaxID=1267003 RepID=A0A0R1GZM5_9LACO|nr:hypothetical protein [Levilactobacillus parabrevis]KRK39193.1 hypothetical protein FD07_GL001816 [Levilactobacillus parabrevis ATCC 53295]KRO06718.1 hypothetical protein IV61_GL002059 [Levilactobacillus parabrevis]MCT4488366.1 hypothetical protein [Levilactobacillus parabrevis]MCT4491530.1 hypothetical protein [Levilactobacillus parabrevis]
MTKGLAFRFHGGATAFIDRLAVVIDDLDDGDIQLLDQITQWSWTNDCVIPNGGIQLSAEEVEHRLEKFSQLELLDYGSRV